MIRLSQWNLLSSRWLLYWSMAYWDWGFEHFAGFPTCAGCEVAAKSLYTGSALWVWLTVRIVMRGRVVCLLDFTSNYFPSIQIKNKTGFVKLDDLNIENKVCGSPSCATELSCGYILCRQKKTNTHFHFFSHFPLDLAAVTKRMHQNRATVLLVVDHIFTPADHLPVFVFFLVLGLSSHLSGLLLAVQTFLSASTAESIFFYSSFPFFCLLSDQSAIQWPSIA